MSQSPPTNTSKEQPATEGAHSDIEERLQINPNSSNDNGVKQHNVTLLKKLLLIVGLWMRRRLPSGKTKGTTTPLVASLINNNLRLETFHHLTIGTPNPNSDPNEPERLHDNDNIDSCTMNSAASVYSVRFDTQSATDDLIEADASSVYTGSSIRGLYTPSYTVVLPTLTYRIVDGVPTIVRTE